MNIACNNTPQEIKAVIFDIDGTLYSNSIMFLSAPFMYIRNVFWIYKFSKMRKRLRRHLSAFPHKEVSIAHKKDFRDLSNSFFSKTTKLPLSEATYILEKRIYQSWILAVGKTPLRYGMRLLLGDLYRNNIKLAILTDFQSREKLDQWGISEYFEVVVCAEDYGILKPDKKIFLETCKQLGVAHDQTLFVGNHVKFDGVGAADADMVPLIFHKGNSKQILSTHGLITFKTMYGFRKILKHFLPIIY